MINYKHITNFVYVASDCSTQVKRTETRKMLNLCMLYDFVLVDAHSFITQSLREKLFFLTIRHLETFAYVSCMTSYLYV